MKRTIIHTSAAIALLLGIAACTQDEAGFLQEGAEGTPIVFTATGLNPAATAIANTRSTVDGDWEGVQSVAVLMDGTVKAYDVTLTTADPASATLTSTDPALLDQPQRHHRHSVVALHRWRDNPFCCEGKSQPKCPERLRGQRPHRSRRTDGDLW